MLLAAALLLPSLVKEAPPDAVKLPKPGVQMRANIAAASSRPWVNANGWRLLRGGPHPFFYDVAGASAALAAAEAYAYQHKAVIHTDAAGTAIFKRMLAFLKSLPEGPSATLANIGVVDDGSPETGEVMNLLARHNLLFRVAKSTDPNLPVNVELGSRGYPKASAANPNEFAQKIRERITDEKRLVRIYGSDVVLAHITGDTGGDTAGEDRRVRIHLINYSDRPVYGLRVRVLGEYHKSAIAAFQDHAELKDVEAADGATEFTLPELQRYAVVDLASK